jgi:hypothetical protein
MSVFSLLQTRGLEFAITLRSRPCSPSFSDSELQIHVQKKHALTPINNGPKTETTSVENKVTTAETMTGGDFISSLSTLKL